MCRLHRKKMQKTDKENRNGVTLWSQNLHTNEPGIISASRAQMRSSEYETCDERKLGPPRLQLLNARSIS